MNKEDKKLLVKDLCARLPYGVIVHLEYDENTSVIRELGIGSLHDIMFNNAEGKPYLRPMSSMTEEEENQYNSLNAYEGGIFPHTEEAFDWLNAHHFDYRGLIENGLALEASEGMYK